MPAAPVSDDVSILICKLSIVVDIVITSLSSEVNKKSAYQMIDALGVLIISLLAYLFKKSFAEY